MKAKISVSSSAKVQVVSFNPVESHVAIEIEEGNFKDDEELDKKIQHYQKIATQRCIKEVMRASEVLIEERAKTFNDD